MEPVDGEVLPVNGEDRANVVPLGDPDETGIGQVHGAVSGGPAMGVRKWLGGGPGML